MSEIVDEKKVAKELLYSLSEDTKKIKDLSADSSYTVQLNSGKELISAGSFEEMKLKPGILQALYRLRYEKPTHIQNIAVPHILNGIDSVFHSKSGTGKTIAFLLGALQCIEKGKGPQVLIIAPVWELLYQIRDVINMLGVEIGVNVVVLSEKEKNENPAADPTAEIVLGSPIKILGLVQSNKIKGENIKMVIVDEADRIVSNFSFYKNLCALFRRACNAQKVLFSATYSEDSQQAIKKLLPAADTFFEKNVKADKIDLFHIDIASRNKIEILKELLGLLTVAQTIVFVATKRMVEVIGRSLADDKFSVSKIHGDLSLTERSEALQDFHAAKTKVLIATDIFSRGMDIPQVNLIINFDLPSYSREEKEETYIHRIGRSGRFNRPGFVIDFVSNEEDLQTLTHIQAHLNTLSKRFTIEALKEAFSENVFGEL